MDVIVKTLCLSKVLNNVIVCVTILFIIIEISSEPIAMTGKRR